MYQYSSAKYYQDNKKKNYNKERLQKRVPERCQSLSKEEKKKAII